MLRDKIIEIFVNVDDFYKEIAPELEKQLIEDLSLIHISFPFTFILLI